MDLLLTATVPRENVLGEEIHIENSGELFLQKCCQTDGKGGCAASGADICLSVTGLAGPDGGTSETPVGTVFMGCCCNGHTVTREYHFTGNRTKIRQQAVASALVLLRECMMGEVEE